MTVAQLIAILQRANPDMPVKLRTDEEGEMYADIFDITAKQAPGQKLVYLAIWKVNGSEVRMEKTSTPNKYWELGDHFPVGSVSPPPPNAAATPKSPLVLAVDPDVEIIQPRSNTDPFSD